MAINTSWNTARSNTNTQWDSRQGLVGYSYYLTAYDDNGDLAYVCDSNGDRLIIQTDPAYTQNTARGKARTNPNTQWNTPRA